MRLPSVSDVNAFRVSKFNEAIGKAMGDPQLGLFRELIEDYERNNDVPALDIAAAIAVLSQDGQPLFLEDMPEPLRVPHKERSNGPAPPSGVRRGLGSYRTEARKPPRVGPRQIVSARANEGRLSREDFGKIDIKTAFSI